MSILNNLKWNATSQLFKIIAQLVSIIYLARLISPSEYGIMAMATVVTNFAILFRDLGTSAAIVQRDSVNEELKSSVFWLNAIIGLAVSLIIISLSQFITNFYNEPKLRIILILLSFNFILLGTSSLHLSLLERESKFKIISNIEMFSYGTALLTAIILAHLGFGVFSLVTQSLMSTILSSALFWHFSLWFPKSTPKNFAKNIKSIFSFSYQLFFFNIINYFSRNLDSILIGKFMTPSILGAYNLAYRIMLFPLTSITFIVNRSLFPILSQKKHNYREVEEIYLNTIYVIWLITLPLIVSLVSLNELFIKIVFGDKWSIVSSILIWLAPTAIIQSVLSTTGTIFMSQGRTGILALLGIQGALLTGVAFYIGVHENITLLAKYYFIANVIHFFPCLIITMSVIRSKFIKVILKTYPLFISAFISYNSMEWIKVFFDENILSLFMISFIGFIIFIAMLLPTKEAKLFIIKIKGRIV